MPYKNLRLKRLNRIKHKEARYAKTKLWKQAHPEKCKEHRDRSKNKDIDKFRKEANVRACKRRAECPWIRTYEGIHCRLRQAKNGARKQKSYIGIKMLMNPSQLKELWFRDKGFDLKNPSIDRVDPDGDYSFDNCRYIEMEENRNRARPRGYRKSCST